MGDGGEGGPAIGLATWQLATSFPGLSLANSGAIAPGISRPRGGPGWRAEPWGAETRRGRGQPQNDARAICAVPRRGHASQLSQD
jgi:hypothetical protein